MRPTADAEILPITDDEIADALAGIARQASSGVRLELDGLLELIKNKELQEPLIEVLRGLVETCGSSRARGQLRALIARYKLEERVPPVSSATAVGSSQAQEKQVEQVDAMSESMSVSECVSAEIFVWLGIDENEDVTSKQTQGEQQHGR